MNCFVGTAIKYIVFSVNDKEAYLCTTRAACNMAFQGVTSEQGKVDELLEIDGVDGAKLVGIKITVQFCA
jgi:leucyl-tRNA synthetase